MLAHCKRLVAVALCSPPPINDEPTAGIGCNIPLSGSMLLLRAAEQTPGLFRTGRGGLTNSHAGSDAQTERGFRCDTTSSSVIPSSGV